MFHLGQSQLSYLRIMGRGTVGEIKAQQHKRPTTQSNSHHLAIEPIAICLKHHH